VRPRRLGGASGRPLNFPVRRHRRAKSNRQSSVTHRGASKRPARRDRGRRILRCDLGSGDVGSTEPASITAKMRSDREFDEIHFLREICELEVSGLDAAADKHVSWAREALRPGSEVTIRILPAGEFDAPRSGDDDA